MPLVLEENRSEPPDWILIVPVKLSNCAEVVPLKLTPLTRLRILPLLPENSVPEIPLPSAPELIVPLVFAGIITLPPKKTEGALEGRAKVAPLLMVIVPLPRLLPAAAESVPAKILRLPVQAVLALARVNVLLPSFVSEPPPVMGLPLKV